MNRRRALAVTLVVASVLMIACSPFIAGRVRADSSYACMFPSSNLAKLSVHGWGYTTEPGMKILDDLTLTNIYHPYHNTYADIWVNNFSNPAHGVYPYIEDYISPDQAPDNATITRIWLFASFQAYGGSPPLSGTRDSHWGPPSMTAAYSFGDPWSAFDGTAGLALPWVSSLLGWAVDVTALESWTPAMVKSPTFWVGIDISPLPMTTSYWCDYVGITYSYVRWGDEGAPYVPPENNQDSIPWIPGGLTGGALIGMMGIVGFIGMVAVPAVLVHQMKHGDRIQNFIGLVGVFVLCLGLFWVGIHPAF